MLLVLDLLTALGSENAHLAQVGIEQIERRYWVTEDRAGDME